MLIDTPRQGINDFVKSLGDLTDDALIDTWHQACLDHAAASIDGKEDAYLRRLAAEAAAVRRFGPGEHLKKLRAKNA